MRVTQRGLWQIRPAYLVGLIVSAAVAVVACSLDRAEGDRIRLLMGSLRAERRLESLAANIRLQEERTEVVRTFEKELKRIRPQITASTCERYANSALSAVDRFPEVDPLLLLAVGIVESHYDERAASPAGALGLYQILPSTGRRLAREMGWDYDVGLLYDAQANTMMATRYLNELITEHDDVGLALAEYNGGPRNAAHFKSGSRRLAEETQSYVPMVLEHYARLVGTMTSSHSKEILMSRLWGNGVRPGAPSDFE